MAKRFLTFEQQIKWLEKNKNLQIPNHAFAEETLQKIGYFGLINGYKEPFKNPTTKNFRDGTTFEDVFALYKFDESLRELFLKYLLQIERHIRSLLSYFFCDKYGESQTNYLNPTCFSSAPKSSQTVLGLIANLDHLANKTSDYPYINHHRKLYGNVPLWVLSGGLSFGTLSKFYAVLTSDLQVKISKNFDGVNEHQLETYLRVMTKFRNVCAHNERLFCYRTQNDIPNTLVHRKLAIPQKGSQFIYGKKDLFAVVIAFSYLLPDGDFSKFIRKLKKIISHYLCHSTAISESELHRLMGFPPNWNSIINVK